MNRRDFLSATIATGLVAPAILKSARPAQAATELRLLTWEGYADDAWVKDFEQENNVSVTKTYVGSNDEYMAKLAAGGGDYDLVVIVSSLAKRAIEAGFVEALDTSLIPNLGELYPRVQTLDITMKDGKHYGIPTFIAIMPVTVNADVIPSGEDFGILFDQKYAGKLAMWDDVSTVGDVASWMGFKDIWNLTDDQLAQVKAKMIAQKPMLRTYWSQAGEAIDLFANKEIVASNSWSYITTTLKQRNLPIRDFYPARPLAALDSHFIVKGSAQSKLGHAFINHIVSAKAQGAIAEISGYTPTNPKSQAFMKPQVWTDLRLDSTGALMDKLTFWDNIPRRAKYVQLLEEVKAA
jgi:spermidine/putrescine-binding protein